MFLTTAGLVRNWAQVQPTAPAIVLGRTGQTLSYRDLDRCSEKLAWTLSRQGIQFGDTVAYLLEGPVKVLALVVALSKLGAAWTPLNPASPAREWSRQYEHVGAVAIVSDLPVSRAILGRSPWISWDHVIADAMPGDRFPQSLSIFQTAGILYTSGTTGIPKGVRHTYKTLWGWNHSLITTVGIHRDDRVANPYPLFHMGGIGFALATLQAGATVILDTPFDPDDLSDSIIRHGATILLLTPTMAQSLVDLAPTPRQDLRYSRLRHLVTTSAPLSTITHQAMQDAWPNLPMSQLYSATEAIFSMARPINPGPSLCVGYPVFGSQLTILDDQGVPLGINIHGTVYVRGLSVLAGYHRSLDQFHAWHDDWVTCFDVGYRDAEGALHLVDRAKDIINSGGEKIASWEIENVLRSHPGIKEVAVVGQSDQYWGEKVHAVVVAKDPSLTEDQVRGFARQHLPSFKVPKTVVFMDALPKTITGKILKRELRQESDAQE